MPTQTCAYVRFPAAISEDHARELVNLARDRVEHDLEIDGSALLQEVHDSQARNKPSSPGESSGLMLDLRAAPHWQWAAMLREFLGLAVIGEGRTEIRIVVGVE